MHKIVLNIHATYRVLIYVPCVLLLVQTLNLAWKSTEELNNSKAFIEVLQFILAIGNYLNYGTRHGSAYGYKLSILPKVIISNFPKLSRQLQLAVSKLLSPLTKVSGAKKK